MNEFLMKKSCIKNTVSGVTLIALVITIIVLLILAGVSIASLTSDNGILTQANKAKKETQKSKVEEDLTIASLNWEMYKKQNITLKQFLEDEQKSNLKGISIISQKDEEILGNYEGHLFIMNKNGYIEVSESNNLVRNGFLEEKNNSGFMNVTYIDEGYLRSTKSDYIYSDFIEVDSNKKYYQSMQVRGEQDFKCYIGIIEYDVDKKNINPQNVMYIQNSLTYLEKDLKPGDTEIYLNNVSGFKLENLQTYQKGLIFWNYKDSTGYEYPELTYSRNVYPRYEYQTLFEIDGVDKTNNKITLNEPWTGEEIKKGTKVSQKNSGSNYNYGLLVGKTLTPEWKTYSNYIQGMNENGDASNYNKFRYGTKYVQMLVMRYNVQENMQTDIKDIVFIEL